MAEPLLGRQPLVASHLPGSDMVTVSSGAAGPAGSLGLDLGAGVEVDVDAAPPHRLVGLTIELPPGDRAAPLPGGVRHGLDVLLGPGCGADLVAFLGDSGRDGMRPNSTELGAGLGPGCGAGLVAFLGDSGRDGMRPNSAPLGAGLGPGCGAGLVASLGDSRRDGMRPNSAPLGAGAPGGTAASPDAALVDPLRDAASPVAPAIHRAAIAHAIACAPGTLPLVRAVALLEAAVELAAIGGILGVDSVVRDDVRIAVELLLDVVAGGVDAMPRGRAGREVAGLLRRVSGLGGEPSLVAARLRSLARELERPGPHRPGAPGPATGDDAGVRAGVRSHQVDRDTRTGPRRPHRHPTPIQAGHPGMPGRVPVDIATLPGSVAEARLAASRIGPSEVEVRIDGWAERRGGLWARAFLAGDGSLLALAPFRADASHATARLLVPPNATARLEVDVTDQPELPRPSTALAAMQRAIHLGRAAAQADRLGDPTAASLRWRQCARHWNRAGDDERAELAQAFGAEAAGSLQSPGRGRAKQAFGAEAAGSLQSPGRRRAQQPVAPLVADVVAAEC